MSDKKTIDGAAERAPQRLATSAQVRAYAATHGAHVVEFGPYVSDDDPGPDPAAARIAHLEGLLHAGDVALEALGVPNHGEPIAERIAKAGHLQSALFRKLREHQEAHAETLGEIAKALDDAGAPDGMPLPERIRALRAADLAAVERVAAAYPPHFAGARHVLGLVREEMAKGPPALSDAEMAAHRGLDAPTRADDEPDPETGWTRAEMRAASSPATRDFLAAMDKLRDGGSEADGLEAFKAFLRAEHAKPVTPAR